MRIILRTFVLLLSIFILIYCKKEKPNSPLLDTRPISEISFTTAISGGIISSDGGAPILARGVCWSNTYVEPCTNDNKTLDGTGTGTFISAITGLTPYTTYNLRAYATNSTGTSYGNQLSFTTSQISTPVLTTSDITSMTRSSIKSGGFIVSSEGSQVTARGVCWGPASNPTLNDNHSEDGTGTGSFVSDITGISVNTKYYLRAYAVNEIGVGYGNGINFTISLGEAEGSVTDIDNNVYTAIKIGTQIWMAENLKVTKYDDGTVLPNITDRFDWGQQLTGAYCWYNNDIINKTPYGALYNFYAVVNPHNLCPLGWHVPSDGDWTTLTSFLGGSNVAATALKESGSLHWSTSNEATNESLFTAIPAGYRENSGLYTSFTGIAFWWSSTEYSQNFAWNRYMMSQFNSVASNNEFKFLGYSVRCIK